MMKKGFMAIALTIGVIITGCASTASQPTEATQSTEAAEATESSTEATAETAVLDDKSAPTETPTDEVSSNTTDEVSSNTTDEVSSNTTESSKDFEVTPSDNQVMYASTNVNYRSLPSTDGEILGSLKLNEKVTVTGYVTEYKGEECLWTEIGEGQFVNAKYLSETPVEVKQTAKSTATQSATTQTVPAAVQQPVVAPQPTVPVQQTEQTYYYDDWDADWDADDETTHYESFTSSGSCAGVEIH